MNCQHCDKPILPIDPLFLYVKTTINGESKIVMCAQCSINYLTMIVDAANGVLFRAVFAYANYNNTDLTYQHFIPEIRK